MKGWKFGYPNLFWEKENEHIKKFSPREFRKYIDDLRHADDAESKLELKKIVRKMIERGSCFEGTLFLSREEVRTFFENEKIWVLDERREPLWKKYANLPNAYQVKRMRDGNLRRNATLS